METAVTVLATLAAVGAALVGGVFFAFSVAVVPAFDRRPPTEAAAAMREINRVIVAPAFLAPFLGLVPVLVALVVLRPTDPLVIVGALAYVGGSVLLTRLVNVPLNDALDAAEPGDAAWRAFRGRWLAANHVRTAASLVSAVSLTLAG